MSRVADSTIKGFLYQFNKTLYEILSSEDDQMVMIEGIVEDIDIHSSTGEIDAIQCKYHETVENYSTSLIFKPLLQMAEAYALAPSSEIRYRIFIHVPNEVHLIRNITINEVTSALASLDRTYEKLIARIPAFDRHAFAEKVTIEFGPNIDELESTVKQLLQGLEIKNIDTECVLYPNSLSMIAKLSAISDNSRRKYSKSKLRAFLAQLTTTIINKWTLSLKNHKDILNTLRKQTKFHLNMNSRNRYLYFEPNNIENFDANIIPFICSFITTYNTKPAHIKTPTIAINCNPTVIDDLQFRLFQKGIKVNRGIVGATFIADEFYREPLISRSKSVSDNREFHLRLISFENEPGALNLRKGDDFYFICDEVPESIATSDINCYQVGVKNFHELEFVMHLRETYE